MSHFLILGKNGNFARSFQQLIRQKQLGTSVQISFADFMNQKHGQKLDLGRENIVLYCFGGKKYIGNDINEPELLTAFLDSVHAKNKNMCSFIFLSTGEVYGNGEKPFTELSQLNPESQYASMKFKCEEILFERAPTLFRQTIIYRVANAYSCADWKSQKNLISKIIASLITKEPFTLTASALSRKQYGTYTDYTKVMFKHFFKAKNELLAEPLIIRNIAPDFSYSIGEIVGLFEIAYPRLFHASRIRGFNVQSDQLELDSRLLESEVSVNFNWARLESELSKSQLRDLN